MQKKIWKVADKKVSKEKDWLINLLLKNRGLKTAKEIKDFLYPSFSELENVKLSQVPLAIKRIKKAIEKNEKVIVYSDYDADGISATAIMWETLNDLGASVMPYIPHRIKEGYGLAVPAIDELKNKGVTLIITVDHGVTAVKQVAHAKKIGVDVIVTDHHVLPKELPEATALVHTTELCGAGVSWRLCWDLVNNLSPKLKPLLLERLELAAIATIADLVPLLGANRYIVKEGVKILSSTKRIGVNALMRASSITPPIGTYEISHMLAPRINAMGRIEHGMDALRLLCTRNKNQAEELARTLARTNTKRQDLTQKAVETAFTLVNEGEKIGVIHDSSWHEGVIGLVASRLVESFNKPMIVIAKGEVLSKGSARSIPGFNIVEAIRSSSEYLIDGGGHPMAAGFTIESRHIESFSQKINTYAQSKITEELLTPKVNIECELKEEDVNFSTLKIIKQLSPFGVGNPEPVFMTKRMLLENVRPVGQTNAHLKLQVGGFSAIAFNMGEKRSALRPGQEIDVAYTISEDRYSGNGNIQLKVKDFSTPN
ncbi:single-stranded-DNA-specific exonuclease RecJ [Candidatus Curtissbacteria bacterium]|nr:single-stranded-DNA-specific exonuclease RecJ [Candidatus Curtissbacteria bacterium]